jgi:hypothetical protein
MAPDGAGPRTAEVRTRHADPETVAAAVRPDNTASMTTRVDGDAVVTTLERETTGGLQVTLDDYVVNVTVAAAVAAAARGDGQEPADERPRGVDAGPDTDTDANANTNTDTDTNP